MANPELLAKLKDVHLPAEVSWWPLAIGWWLLIFFFISALVAFIIYRVHQTKKFRLSKIAIKEIEAVASSDDEDWLIQLEVLLKRVSLGHFPKQQVASLTQDSWIQFLIQTGANVWNDESLILLKDSVYQDANNISSTNKEQLFAQSKQWILMLPNGANRV